MGIEWLLGTMARWSGERAVIWKDQEYTYGSILNSVAGWREELRERKVQPGRVVSIEGDYSPETIALLLALIDLNAIVVPLTSAAEAHRSEFLEISETRLIISIDDWDRPTFEWRPVHVANPLTRGLIEQGEPGLVLFSSGSTGKSKAALHNFSLLLEKFRGTRSRMCTLTFLLLDHIGGINTLLYTLSNGGTVVAAGSRAPDVVCESIARHGVELLPASPTFLNLLLISGAHSRHDLSCLKRITYGTEVMPETTLKRLHEAFPGVELQQTYGLSELGILRSKSRGPNSLWVKLGGEGFETKVKDGTLRVRARSAMLGYLNAPSPFDEEGWMNTQDVVEVDGEYFRILGRQTDIINVGGQKVYPAAVESVLMEVPNVRDATVFGRRNGVTGQIVAARITAAEPESQQELRKRIWNHCRAKLEPYMVPALLEIGDSVPITARQKKARTAQSQ